VKIILLINKKETEFLETKGVHFGENGISSTGKVNGRHKYYLCESSKNMGFHHEYEKLIGVAK
jgi:hypothetical protein